MSPPRCPPIKKGDSTIMSKKILQLISADFEDLEVWYPVYRCREEGWQVDFAAEKPGLYHGKYGVP